MSSFTAQFTATLERFIGIIIENFKGIFPFWLSPSQVGIVPIREEHNEYAKRVFDFCRRTAYAPRRITPTGI